MLTMHLFSQLYVILISKAKTSNFRKQVTRPINGKWPSTVTLYCHIYLNFRYRVCFKQGIPWHSGSDKVWIGFNLKRVRHIIRTYSQIHCTDKYSQYNSIIWPVWLNVLIVRLPAKWWWVRVLLQSLKLYMSHLFRAKSSLTLRQL